MKPLVGVLLNRRILQRGIRGAPVFERLPLYVKAARELDIDVVFFDTDGVRARRNEVIGYTPTEKGKLKRRVVPLPLAVHKRGLFRNRKDINVIQKMQDKQVYMFNSETRWDKYRIHEILFEQPELHPYLPQTALPQRDHFEWFKNLLEEDAEVFIKARKGSLGIGIARVWRVGSGQYRYESRRLRKKMTLKAIWKLALKSKRTHLLQKGIELLEDHGRRVDFRVPVQRDGNNQWNIAGIAGKRAKKLSFLTNLAQGASVYEGRELLTRNFGVNRADAIIDEIHRVCVLAAQTLNNHHSHMVDFGIDIGVDKSGHPYVIEVNRRDLRILFRQSRQPKAFETLYKNPLAYGRFILEQQANVNGLAKENTPFDSVKEI